jgi:acyl-CoA synthetase (AMP-forming)/AMP-acid ligase II
LPLFHDMGLIGVVLTALCHGYPIHLLAPETFVMSPRRWLALIAEAKGTLTAAPNFAYDYCVSRARDDWQRVDLSSLRIALNGAEPVHKTTIDRFVDRFRSQGLSPDALMPVYGMAECTLAVAFPSLRHKLRTLRVDRTALEEGAVARLSCKSDAYEAVSVGRPVAGMSLGVFNQAGTLLAPGQVGEIRVGGPSLMDGYFRNETATREVLVDGLLRTGDLGFIAEDHLFITGRSKELIIKGGRNIHPDDVERAASAVPGLRVGGVAAFARGNLVTGTDDLVVLAETLERDAVSHARIEREVRGEILALLGVKVDAVHLCRIGGLPRTSSGKIKRRTCATLVPKVYP